MEKLQPRVVWSQSGASNSCQVGLRRQEDDSFFRHLCTQRKTPLRAPAGDSASVVGSCQPPSYRHPLTTRVCVPCRFSVPAAETIRGRLQGHLLAGLLQQLCEPAHLPLLQSRVQARLPPPLALPVSPPPPPPLARLRPPLASLNRRPASRLCPQPASRAPGSSPGPHCTPRPRLRRHVRGAGSGLRASKASLRPTGVEAARATAETHDPAAREGVQPVPQDPLWRRTARGGSVRPALGGGGSVSKRSPRWGRGCHLPCL